MWLNECMALPSILRGKHPSEIKKFLALDIGLEVVTAGLWTLQNGKTHVISSSSAIEWQDQCVDELAEASDVALEELGADATKIDEVLLGLPEEWVQNDHITAEKRPLLKTVKEELSLKPIGFVVTREAIIHYLHQLEGGPLTALVLEFTSTHIAVCSIKASTKGETCLVGRSGDTASDVTEALSRLHLDTYPARMIVYSVRLKHEELEAEKQKLLAYDWQKQFAFLHTPKVEVLPHALAMTAVCAAGGSAYAKRIEEPEHQESMQEEKVQEKERESKEKLSQPSEEISNVVMPEQADFDFQELPQTQPEQEEYEHEEEPSHRNVVLPKTSFSFFVWIQRTFRDMFTTLFAGRSLGTRFTSEVSGAKTARILFLVVVCVVLTGGGVGWWMLSNAWRATATITLRTEPITTKAELTLNAQASQTDAENNVLKVSKITEEVSGDIEGETTGTKIVGDRAKGKVTIYNATSGEKTLKAGTLLSGPKGLNVTLDEDVIVASSSGSSLLNTQWGSVVAHVTATNIGQESNLPAKTEFMVANFDKKSYVASNEESLTGGTSREIQAVSKEDLARLEKVLSKQLQQQAVDAIKTRQQSGKQIVSVSDPTIKEKKYSAKVGDEARNISLTMKVVAQALEYQTSDLFPIAQQKLQESLPEGSLLREEKVTIDPQEVIASSSATVKLRAVLSSERILTIDKKYVADRIKGTTPEQAQSLLREHSSVANVEVRIEPWLAKFIFGKLPLDSEKIIVQTQVSP